MGGERTYQPKWDPKTVLTTTAICQTLKNMVKCSGFEMNNLSKKRTWHLTEGPSKSKLILQVPPSPTKIMLVAGRLSKELKSGGKWGWGTSQTLAQAVDRIRHPTSAGFLTSRVFRPDSKAPQGRRINLPRDWNKGWVTALWEEGVVLGLPVSKEVRIRVPDFFCSLF